MYFGMLFVTIVMMMVVTTVGLRVCDLLPWKLRAVARGYFSPILGLAILILICVANGWLTHFRQSISVAITVALLLYSLRQERRLREWAKLQARVCLFTIISSTPILFPILQYDAYNPFNDTFTYLEHSQWLQSHAFSEPGVSTGDHPAETQIVLYQHTGSRMGASFFVAWVQATFGLEWSYYAYVPAILVPLLASSLVVGGTIILLFRRQTLIPQLVACATATTVNGWVFGATYGFLPQTFGLAFAVASVALLGGSMALIYRRRRLGTGSAVDESANRLWSDVAHASPVALSFAGLGYTYNDLLPFIVLAIVLFLIVIFYVYSKLIKPIASLVLMVLAESVMLLNCEFLRMWNNFFHYMLGIPSGSVQFGWPVVWSVWEFGAFSLGLKSSNDDLWLFYFKGLTLAVFLLIVLAAAYATVKQLRRPLFHFNVLLHLFVLASLVGGFLYFRYVVHGFEPNEVGLSFAQFKLSKWASPFAFVLVGATGAYLAQTFRRSERVIAALIALCIPLGLIANFKASKINNVVFPNATGYPRESFSELLDLRQLAQAIPNDQVIYLDLQGPQHKIRQMVTYVLPEHRLASDYSDDGYMSGTLGPRERTKSFNGAPWLVRFSPPDARDLLKHARAGNLVIERSPETLVSLLSTSGGYNREADAADWWNWTSGTLSYRFRVAGAVSTKRLRFTCVPASLGRKLRVQINSGQLTEMMIPMESGLQTVVSPAFPVSGSAVVVDFSNDLPPIRISESDPRMMAYRIINLELVDYDGPHLVSVEGGYPRENEGDTWRYWTSAKLEFHYQVPEDLKTVRLKFTYLPAVPGSKLFVHVVSTVHKTLTLAMKAGWNEYQSKPVRVGGNSVTVGFTTNQHPLRLSASDPRMVVFLVQNLQLVGAEK